MAVRVQVYPQGWQEQVMALSPVSEQMRATAHQIGQRAQAELSSVGGTLFYREGVRPLGRPYVSVGSDQVGQEFGTSKIKRRRILGRAANIETGL